MCYLPKTDIKTGRNGSVDNDLGSGKISLGFSRKQEIFVVFFQYNCVLTIIAFARNL